jgi:hypothetical protein
LASLLVPFSLPAGDEGDDWHATSETANEISARRDEGRWSVMAARRYPRASRICNAPLPRFSRRAPHCGIVGGARNAAKAPPATGGIAVRMPDRAGE